jgi:hypothetical protein
MKDELLWGLQFESLSEFLAICFLDCSTLEVILQVRLYRFRYSHIPTDMSRSTFGLVQVSTGRESVLGSSNIGVEPLNIEVSG